MLEINFLVNFVQTFCSCLTENTMDVRYKENPVVTGRINGRSL